MSPRPSRRRYPGNRGSGLLQPTTRLHVSGYRFLVRRMEHALVRGDTRMLDDPIRAQSISLAVGGILAAAILGVSVIVALVRPAGEIGDAAIVVVRDSGATYVQMGDVLHPVFNMASARLIAGMPVDPRMVDQRAVDSAHRGPQLGIPGAPASISTPLTSEESSWTVCDDAGGETVVIAGPIADTAMASESGVLVRPRGGSAATTYLLYGSRRARVDLRHPAVVRALRLEGIAPQPISASILSAIPEAPEIAPPHIPGAGSPGPRRLRGYPVGSVLKVVRTNADSEEDYFVVLANGVQRIGEVTADLIRYTDSHVGGQIPTVAPDLIAAVPVRETLPVGTFPESSGATEFPVVCARWRAGPTGGDASTTVLGGEAAPLISRPAALAQADADGPAVDAVAVPPGRSVFAHSVGLTGGGQGAGSLYLITDTGVLYGIRDGEAASSLGLTAPAQPAPWPVLSALPHGPELSRRDASVARDGLVASP
ncbi:MAG: type VII secretion protein EccB [Mycobacterium sp.]